MLMKYPGSKFSCRELLIDYAPHEFDEFRSAFCGNEPLLWSLPVSMPRWINDKDEMVYRYFVALRDDPGFIRQFQRLRNAGMNSLDDSVAIFRDCIKRVQHHKDPVAYLYVRRLAHNQIAGFHRKDFAAYSYKFGHDHSALRSVTTDRMREARSIIQGVKITNLDYAEVLRAPTTGDCCWIMADPPYLMNHHASAIYQHYFTMQQRQQLKAHLLRLNRDTHKVMLTIEESEVSHGEYVLDSRVDVLYREYTSFMAGKKKTRDLIITNYDL